MYQIGDLLRDRDGNTYIVTQVYKKHGTEDVIDFVMQNRADGKPLDPSSDVRIWQMDASDLMEDGYRKL